MTLSQIMNNHIKAIKCLGPNNFRKKAVMHLVTIRLIRGFDLQLEALLTTFSEEKLYKTAANCLQLDRLEEKIEQVKKKQDKTIQRLEDLKKKRPGKFDNL